MGKLNMKLNKLLLKDTIQMALTPDFDVETHYKGKGDFYDIRVTSPNGEYRSWMKVAGEVMNGVEPGILWDYIGKIVKQSFEALAMKIYY